jgi:hypothetical protein
MRTVSTRFGLALGLLLAATAAWAQDKKAAPPPEERGFVHRMVIYNGPVRTVHYINRGLSPGEQAAARDLERAENEVALADQLLDLRIQYVADEQALQAHRRHMQELLYGYSSQTTAQAGVFSGPGYGYSPYYGYGGYWGRGWGGGWGGYASVSSSAFNSLAYGVGDEGVIKSEMARTLAGQAVPEYAARAGQGLSAALARASQYESFRSALGLRAKEPPPPEESTSAFPADAAVVVTRLRDGKSEKVEGKFVSSDKDWLVIQTKDGRLHIPQSQVGDILERAK